MSSKDYTCNSVVPGTIGLFSCDLLMEIKVSLQKKNMNTGNLILPSECNAKSPPKFKGVYEEGRDLRQLFAQYSEYILVNCAQLE